MLYNSIRFVVIPVIFLCIGTVLYMFSFYHTLDTQSHADCAVVFGAAVLPGGKPSDALSDRVLHAIDLYKEGRVGCLLFSGADSVYGRHEVDVMLDIAYQRDIPYGVIRVDYNGKNTKATIENLDKNKSYIFVSSDFHLARISLLAHQAGIGRYYLSPSPYRNGRYTDEKFLLLREVIAFWYYIFIH